MNHTGFFYDERCFWHSTGAHATIIPVGGWVQPPADAGHAESPESKRRLRNLLDVSGLLAQLDVHSAPPAPVEALVRIHPMYYLREFKRISESGGGTMGEQASPGPDSYHYATLSAGRGYNINVPLMASSGHDAYRYALDPLARMRLHSDSFRMMTARMMAAAAALCEGK